MVRKGIVAITGVTNGLGKALVYQFAKLGWKIAGCARSVDPIRQLQNELSSNCLFSVVDVSDESAVDLWKKEVLAKVGIPDLLINNAAVVNRRALLWEISPSEFSHIMEVNVNGVFHVLRAFIPSLIQHGKGVIVNISSGWGKEGEASVSPYCASKFAVEGLTQSLARELPQTISVVALDPGGGVNTAMLQKCYGEEAKNYPSPEEWAQLAVPYLLSLSRKENGKSLTVPTKNLLP